MPASRDPAKRARQLANLAPAPPLTPLGNRRAATHGAYAAIAVERVELKARQLFDAVASDAPVRDAGELPSHDGVVVRLLAETLCRIDDVAEFIARRGWQDDKGRPRSAVLEIEQRLRSQALDLLRELGMTPRSRAALGLDLVRVASAQDQLAEHVRDTYGGGAVNAH
jgi:hypothetical protein